MEERELVRAAAESDLLLFARLVQPNRVYGDVHEELFRWWTRPKASDHQLVLLPRDHQKSHCIAVRVAWWITKHPDTTVIYLSATANLAEKQLKAIKDILDSPVYRRYWPEMIAKEESKRERWTANEISVDHPLRKAEGVRDPTIVAAGVTKNITGLHCNIAVLDDLVVPANAYTEEGRASVEAAYSQLASVETTGAKEWIVGTRYHPNDLYAKLTDMEEEIYDLTTGELREKKKVYEVFERVVETGGEFLWPRQIRGDGKAFGFDYEQLARKKAKYLDIEQFYAQYYNNPNSLENQSIDRTRFQYYDVRHLKYAPGGWYFNGRKLNVVAAIDFAFSLSKKSDYTAIVVIGIDSDHNIYIMDIERFKATNTGTYFDKIFALHNKWNFRKLRAEVTVAQSIIVNDLKQMIGNEGLALSVDEHRPNRTQGSKEERIAAALDHRYQNQKMWHFKGGYITMLEEELVMQKPPHDDIKDALASAVEIAKAPPNESQMFGGNVSPFRRDARPHSRFGGYAA